jgi:hypothetical protein
MLGQDLLKLLKYGGLTMLYCANIRDAIFSVNCIKRGKYCVKHEAEQNMNILYIYFCAIFGHGMPFSFPSVQRIQRDPRWKKKFCFRKASVTKFIISKFIITKFIRNRVYT